MLLDTIQLHLELNMVSETIMRSLTLYTHLKHPILFFMIEMKRQLSNDNEIMQASKLICTSMHSLVSPVYL